MQRHAGGALHALGDEGFAGVQAVMRGVADHHAGRLEARCRHAGKAPVFQQRTHLPAQRQLLLPQALEAVIACLQHRVAAQGQCVGGHGRVIGVAAVFVGLHDLQPLLQVQRETGVGRRFELLSRQVAEHHKSAAGRAAPALLWRADQHVHAGGGHVDPQRAGGDAVEHEQRADFVRRIGHRAQVVVGQQQAGGCFDAARHDDGRRRSVDVFQHAGNVAHHALELLRHVVERAVGEDHRILEQTVGVDGGQQSGHGEIL